MPCYTYHNKINTGFLEDANDKKVLGIRMFFLQARALKPFNSVIYALVILKHTSTSATICFLGSFLNETESDEKHLGNLVITHTPADIDALTWHA